MPKVIKTGRCRTVIGHKLFPGVPTEAVCRTVPSLRKLMHVPVTWNGQIQTMYFHAQTQRLQRKEPLNRRATDLFARDGFRIYGPVIIEETKAIWNYLRFAVPEDYLRSRINHLALGRYDVVPTERDDTVVDVLLEDDQDMPVMKMALAI